MDFSEIEEIVDRDGKSSAPDAIKVRYIELMVEILNEQDISGKSAEYLRKGFSFAGARPIVKYLSGLDKHVAEEKISRLFRCNLFKAKDRVTGFRMCASLIGFALEEFDINRKILKECIMTMPSTSKNKHGELLADAPKAVKNYMIEFVSEDTKLPALESLGLKEIFVNEFKSMMVSILEKIQDGPRTKVEKFMLWVDPTRLEKASHNAAEIVVAQTAKEAVASSGEDADSAEKNNLGHINQEKEVIAAESEQRNSEESTPALAKERQQPNQCEPVADIYEKDATDTTEKDKEPATDSADIPNKDKKAGVLPEKIATTTEGLEMAQGASLLVNLAERMNAWAAKMEEMASVNGILAKNNDELLQQIGQLQTALEKEKNAYLAAQTEIEAGTKTIADLKTQLIEAQRGNTELKVQSTATHEEIARLNSILSVYSADKENAQREQLNSIAAKLRTEYRDFKDAENDEMTVDLGENFRFQLTQIFKILIKAGIDVEKR